VPTTDDRRSPTAPVPYLLLPGTARAALHFYADLFGGRAELHSFSDFGRSDGRADAIAHGLLLDSPVTLYLADAGEGERPFEARGLMFSLLGTADAATLRRWFAALAAGGTVVDELQPRPWGASDGQVVDRHGLRWLVGFESDS
jgi:PhnB protein